MKEAVYVIENVIGRLFHGMYEGDVVRLGELFAADAVLVQREAGRRCVGKEEVLVFWQQQIQGSRNAEGRLAVCYLPCDIYLEQRGGRYYGEWDTYSFRNEAPGEIQYFLSHMQAEFWPEGGAWRFGELVWNEILELEPWPFSEGRQGTVAGRLPWMEEKGDGLSLQDYMEIRNLQGHFTQEGMDRREEWFSGEPGVRLSLPTLKGEAVEGKAQIGAFLERMRKKELENGKNYLFLPIVTAPLIYGEGECARGLWLALTVEVKAGAFGIQEPPYGIEINIGRFSQEFVRENGRWRFRSFCHEPAIVLERFAYRPQKGMRHRMREGDQWENTWLPGPEETGVPCPEDVSGIEMMMAQWTGRLRKGSSLDFVDRYMVNSQEEISMLVAGSTRKRTCGYEEICRRFGPRERTGRRENPVFHTLASPVIEFSEDGRHAKAAWTDVSMADFSGAFDFPLEPVCYHMTVSKYYHEFVREGGEWKLFSFGWEPGVFLGGFPFEAKKCRGFYKGWEETGNEFPMIGEPYPYE